MGASDISFELKGKASESEIEKRFKAQAEQDAEENGHASGYSGDFQTVRRVDYHLYKIFDNVTDAMNYCLDNAKKWESVVAVYYKLFEHKPSKRLVNLGLKIKKLEQDHQALEGIHNKLPSEGFKVCPTCKSRLALARVQGVHCPLCSQDLRSKSVQNRFAKLNAKVDALRSEAMALEATERAKLAAKSTKVNTLVAGWGAS